MKKNINIENILSKSDLDTYLTENKNSNAKRRVLLHSCCGPCSSYCINYLLEGFEIDVFYSNSNIDTEEEFMKRLKNQEKVLGYFNKKNINLSDFEINYPSSPINLIVDKYEPTEYYQTVKGYENLKERSKRCYLCYYFRLEKTARYAKEHHYDAFTTTLSVSPYKNSDWLNEIGFTLSKKYQIPFIYTNFKKNEGYKKSIIL